MLKIKCLLLLCFVFTLAHTASARADKSMVGQPLPALKVTYLNQTPELAGKPMILEFWATWCPPCRESIPHLNEVYSKYKDKGLVIVGVTKEKKKVVEAFLAKMPMSYFPALDTDGALNKQFAVTGIPHAVLVDKTGKIVWEGHPMSLKDANITALLN
jgi:thiol-disulfide isomerase/thioredoxin